MRETPNGEITLLSTVDKDTHEKTYSLGLKCGSCGKYSRVRAGSTFSCKHCGTTHELKITPGRWIT